MVQIEEISADKTPAIVALKEEGNVCFKSGDFSAAIELYSKAIELCKEEEKPAKAILLCNRATSKFHLGKFEECIADCSLALDADPEYRKAYYRRSLAHEKVGDFSSAVDDGEHFGDDKQRIKTLVKKRDEKLEKDKAEMMKNLKEIGNSILGKFGMSTDDFKFDKDPVTGSYSMKINNKNDS